MVTEENGKKIKDVAVYREKIQILCVRHVSL